MIGLVGRERTSMGHLVKISSDRAVRENPPVPEDASVPVQAELEWVFHVEPDH